MISRQSLMDEPLQPLNLPRGVRDVMNDPYELQIYGDWKSTAGIAMHPGFGKETQYNSQRAEWRTPPIQDLEAALSSAYEIDPTFQFQNRSWDDVLEYIQSAEKAYNAKADNNRVRCWLREGKSFAQTLNSLVDLIPDDNGLRTLRVGLSFIFQAWQQRSENGKNILQTLSDVPALFSYAIDKSKLYPVDQKLRIYVRDLYETILESLAALIKILLRTHQGPWIKRLGKQLPSQEADDVNNIVNLISNAKERIYSRVNILDDERLASIDRNAKVNLREVQATRQKLHSTSHQVSTLTTNVNGIGQNVMNIGQEVTSIGLNQSSMGQNMDIIGQKVENVLAEGQQLRIQVDGVNSQVLATGEDVKTYLDAVIERGITRGVQEVRESFKFAVRGLVKSIQPSLAEIMQNALYQMKAEDIYTESLRIIPRVVTQERRLNHQPVHLITERLLGALDVNPLLPTQEAEHILRQSSAMRPEALGQARWLLSTVPFKDWLRRPSSGIVLVDGYCKDLGIGKTSPLSIFCASFAATLAQSESCIVLYFFCGQHSRPRDQVGGPKGLMRSLISQLILYLDKPDPELKFVEQTLYEAILRQDTAALCFLFKQIIHKANSSKTIYCVIDNISDFESPLYGWDKDILDVVKHLRGLVDNQRPGPMLKLLMTSANRTINLIRMVDQNKGEHISLRAGNVHNRPMQRQAFAQDIRRLMTPPPPENIFLAPAAPGGFGNEMQREYAYVGRRRSSGSDLPRG